jgi:uncharacterized protein YukE
MADGFQVNPDELSEAGQRVSGMAARVSILKGHASTARVPTQSWGLLGLATTYSKYSDLKNQLHDHLSKMGLGIAGVGGNLSSTGDAYRQVDQAHATNLTNLDPHQARHEQHRWPGSPGGN